MENPALPQEQPDQAANTETFAPVLNAVPDLDVESPQGYAIYDSWFKVWLEDDERTWGPDFMHAAIFLDLQLAIDIGAREARPGGIIRIMGVM